MNDYETLAAGRHANPHAVLGAHSTGKAVVVRTLKPLAASVVVIATADDGVHRFPAEHEHEGVWRAVLPTASIPDYRLEVTYADGIPHIVDDPYRYLPTLGDVDLHLINEGRHERLWEVLGAHVRRYPMPLSSPTGTVTGTSFAVWAPHAKGVRVKGDFNGWDGREHPMRSMGVSGVWELFIPDVGSGSQYKYDVLGADDVWRQKADPLATRTETPPATSSVVYESGYTWGDAGWLDERERRDPLSSPMSIYEVHLGSWRRGRSYPQLADELVGYVADHGFTHVELLPVMEHPFGGSWGYQVTSYFAPTARFGTPDDLRYLVDRFHQAGIGVILDWVPAHFPKDAFALASFDGTPLYEDPNPLRGEHPEWGTYVFNFGRSEVRNFLYASALYWLEEFHVDGLRVDAVASMLYLDYAREPGQWAPNVYGGRENLEAVHFVKELNATCYKRAPGIVMIAEESTSWPGVTKPTSEDGLGFGLKWNMGWMHDTLGYLEEHPLSRKHHHNKLTFSMMYAYSERFVLPLSHDEVVHGKGSLLGKLPGTRPEQLATLRAMLAYQWAHPGKQLLFMGGELGQEAEWAEHRELDWWLLDHPEHRGVQRLVGDLNRTYAASPALWAADYDPAGFRWIDANDEWRNTFSFMRFDPASGDAVACVVNFAGIAHHDLQIGLPAHGVWKEVLNTDAEVYGGSGVGNYGAVMGVKEPSHGLPASAHVSVPALGAIWLRTPGT